MWHIQWFLCQKVISTICTATDNEQFSTTLQDLLKYTSPGHPDRITLQMALAHLEGIASYLNEAKRLREQQEVVSNLSAAVTRLPFKLSDSKRRWLHRQDVVTRLVRPHP